MDLFARCGSCKVKKVFSDGICQFDKTGIGPFIVETSTAKATSHTKRMCCRLVDVNHFTAEYLLLPTKLLWEIGL